MSHLYHTVFGKSVLFKNLKDVCILNLSNPMPRNLPKGK